MVVQAYLFLVNKLDRKTPKMPRETIQAATPLTEPQISNPPYTESRALPQQAVASLTSSSGNHQMPTQLWVKTLAFQLFLEHLRRYFSFIKHSI